MQEIKDAEPSGESVQSILERSKARAKFWDTYIPKDRNLSFTRTIKPSLPSCPENGCDNLESELGVTSRKTSVEQYVAGGGKHADMIDSLYDKGYMTCGRHSEWQAQPPDTSLPPVTFTTCNTFYKPLSDHPEQFKEAKRSSATDAAGGSLQCMVQIPDYVTQSNGQVPPWPFVANGKNRCSLRHVGVEQRRVRLSERVEERKKYKRAGAFLEVDAEDEEAGEGSSRAYEFEQTSQADYDYYAPSSLGLPQVIHKEKYTKLSLFPMLYSSEESGKELYYGWVDRNDVATRVPKSEYDNVEDGSASHYDINMS